ncbi:MAG: hypothetical protein ACKPKO_53095, partial [Candidatus Fonsibacter sp.]
GGPVKAAWQCDIPANNIDTDPPRNTLKLFTTGDVEFDLPILLQTVGAEQRDILSAIGTANATVHVIHGLAGCGKSTLLQCLVAIYATHHSRFSAADRGAEAILLTLQVLRHEFVQALLHTATLQPNRFLRWAVARQLSGDRQRPKILLEYHARQGRLASASQIVHGHAIEAREICELALD